MNTLNLADYLKFANLQMAAEALYGYDATEPDTNLIPGAVRENWAINADNNLITGNLHSSQFTATQLELSGLASDWVVVEHKSNTSTGFSGTLFKHKDTGELVMSFRSTEFIDDAARDNQATNALEIKELGWAFGQIDDMQDWYASLGERGLIDGPLSVTGYSLGGHLATAFNLLYPDAAQQVVTFNGAGVGKIKDGQGDLASVMAYFDSLRNDPTRIEAAITKPELLEVYLELRAEFSALIEAGAAYSSVQAKSAFDSFKQSADDRLMAIWPADPFVREIDSLERPRELIQAALSRAGNIFIEAHRAPELPSGGDTPSNPANIPDGSIAQQDLDYQMAVLLTAERTEAVQLLGNTVQTFFGRKFADEEDLASNQFDVMGVGEPSAVANSQIHYGADIKVFIEDQPLMRGDILQEAIAASFGYTDVKLLVPNYADNDFGDTHSLVLILDSLNVQNTLLQLVPEAQRQQAESTLVDILRSASWWQRDTDLGQGKAEGDVLENMVNALARMFLGDQAASVKLNGNPAGNSWHLIDDTDDAAPFTGREALYAALDAIRKSAVYDALLGKVNLVVPTTEGSVARTDFAQFLALYHLSPFALEVDDQAALSALIAAQGELGTQWQADKELSPDQLAGGEANFSDTWLQDRADLLVRKLWFGAANLNPAEINDQGPEYGKYRHDGAYYEDVASGYRIAQGFNPDKVPYFIRQYRFGGEDGDEFTGGTVTDHLYGGAGNDILKGEAGHDHLEGGKNDDTLIGGRGNDTLIGGADNDRYEFSTGDGNDLVVDSDGEGSLWLDGVPLKGGKETHPGSGIWKSEDGQITYYLSPNTDQTKTLFIKHGSDLIRVQQYRLGQLDITLRDAVVVADATEPTLVGDKKPIDRDPAEPGVQYGYDPLGNELTTEAVEVRSDRLFGGTGSDLIQGLGDNDILYGNSGDDTLEGGSDRDQLFGQADNDLLIGGGSGDVLIGGVGDDRLYADSQVSIELVRQQTQGSGLQGDWLSAGLGEDLLLGDVGNDVLLGGGGRDTLFGGAGDDVLAGDLDFTPGLWWDVQEYGNVFRRVFQAVSIDTHNGELADSDFLFGGAGDDYLAGWDGDDWLSGEADQDTLVGGSGNDLLFGGDGNDHLTGDYGYLLTAGSSGPFSTVPGNDTLDGGAGDDWLQGDAGDDLLIGGSDNDTLRGDADYLAGAEHGNDQLEGGLGNDWLYGYGGDDALYGGEGNDQLVGDHLESVLAGQFHGKDTLYGGAGADTLTGVGGDDELYGGSGDDQLIGDAIPGELDAQYHGNDLLHGDAGNDSLLGGYGNDTLVGGIGTDALHGGVGDDTYLFETGDGNDRISDSEGVNVIRFGVGINRANLTFKQASAAVGAHVLQVEYLGGSISIIDGTFGAVSRFEFADGSMLSYAESMRYLDSLVLGGDSADTLKGDDGNDTLDGGAGNDYLDGGFGNNTYRFGRGDGQDTIDLRDVYWNSDKRDVVQFKAGISASDIDVAYQGGGDGYSQDLILKVRGSEDQLRVRNYFSYGLVESIQFADGTSWDIATVKSKLLTATEDNDTLRGFDFDEYIRGLAGNDYLFGANGNDTLDGGAGNDQLLGGRGDDIFLFGRGDGQDIIARDYVYNEQIFDRDVVRFKTGIAPADIMVKRGINDSLVLSIRESQDRLQVADYFIYRDGANSRSIREFQFADGTSWGYETLKAMSMVGTEETDYLYGTPGDDTLDGGAGTDFLYGEAGNDTYLFGRGDGNDILWSSDANISKHDVVQIKAGVSPTDIDVVRPGYTSDLVLAIRDSQDSLVIRNYFSYGSEFHSGGIELIRFADGASWDYATVKAKVLIGTNGDDTISGYDTNDNLSGLGGSDYLSGAAGDDMLAGGTGNDELWGGAGNDTLHGGEGYDILDGGSGNDVYLFNRGDGHDVVNNSDVISATDTIRFGVGISDSDVLAFSRGGGAVTLKIKNSADQIELRGYNYAANTVNGIIYDRKIDRVEFTNGVVWDQAKIQEILDQTASNKAPVISGSVPELEAYQGSAFNYAFTLDTITDPDIWDSIVYSVKMQDGAALPSWLSFDPATRTLSGTPGSADVGNMQFILSGTDNYGATASTYVNFSVLPPNQTPVLDDELDNLLRGNTADNVLHGGAGNDTLHGGAGADTLYGGLDDDLYVVDDAGDVVIEYADEGIDRVSSSISWTLGENLENLTLTGSADIDGTGNELDNVLYGNAGNNVFRGGAGNDTLNGSVGADTLYGGIGNDVYVVDNLADKVIEQASEGADRVYSSISWALGDNLENLTLTGSADIDGTGNELGNVLYGNAGNNVLGGGAGNDILNGGMGGDTLYGGIGNDVYVVDAADDSIIEYADEGIDKVNSSISWALGEHLENLILTGSDAIDGTGNERNNLLHGNAANNVLWGGAGDDIFNGGLGADTMYGGSGDEVFVVDNPGDMVVEYAGEGIDRINSSISWALGDNLENLILTGNAAIDGTGNELNNSLHGNVADNVLWGDTGNDTLRGGTGNDTYLFGRGDGVDRIMENDATPGNSDLALFGADISQEQLWFRHSNSHLEVSIIGSSDKLIVHDWYLGQQHRVERFQTSEGKTLLDGQVQNLVDAMASFGVPAGAESNLTADQRAQLDMVIAANWQ